MTHLLTRRSFLQLTGVLSVSATLLPSFMRAFAQGIPRREYARLLRSVVSPDGRTRLLSSTAVTVNDDGMSKYRWLNHTDVQTMPGFQPNTPSAAPIQKGRLVEVCTPSAILYQRCDVLSPILGALGYGSGARIADSLPAARRGGAGWFQLADDSGRALGWSQANLWRSADIAYPSRRFDHVRIDRHNQSLTLFDGTDAAASWAISTSTLAWTGRASTLSRAVRFNNLDRPLTWSIFLSGGLAIGGADWHNDFGTPHGTANIEMHPYLSRWLYHHLADEATIDIV